METRPDDERTSGMTDDAPARRSPRGGRLALILAAERLIALHGLSGVSLREINEAAGFRNVAATHYHFGSRDGVVEGIFAYRLPALQARREAYIQDLKAAGAVSNVRGLIGAAVWPLVEELRPRPEGNYYLRFVEQCKREREDSPLIVHGNEMASTWAWVTAQLRQNLKHLPPQVARLRLRLEYAHM